MQRNEARRLIIMFRRSFVYPVPCDPFAKLEEMDTLQCMHTCLHPLSPKICFCAQRETVGFWLFSKHSNALSNGFVMAILHCVDAGSIFLDSTPFPKMKKFVAIKFLIYAPELINLC
jgi:hypothetical protein